jgi:hypothetical protein
MELLELSYRHSFAKQQSKNSFEFDADMRLKDMLLLFVVVVVVDIFSVKDKNGLCEREKKETNLRLKLSPPKKLKSD